MDNPVAVSSPAKLNLVLDIIGKRADGYHFLASIMQTVNIFDTVKISYNEASLNGLEISCNVDNIPCDSSNLAYKAAKAFFEHFDEEIPNGITIEIDKDIPQCAGMAGGSADAAATFVALNKLFEKELTVDELCEIAATVGADIPFCIQGGTMLCEGIGDILTPMPNMPECYFVVAKPDNVDISTPEAYSKFDQKEIEAYEQIDDFIASLTLENLDNISELLFNALEIAVDNEEISILKNKMIENSALGAVMTGSGSAVFGIFDKKRTAQKCADDLEDEYKFVRVCTPCNHGAQILEEEE